MALPTSRGELKEYIKRQLGAPLLRINVADDQIDDRIDEALQMWIDYHHDGTEKTYWLYKLTQADIDNKYITVDPTIVGISQILPMGSILHSTTDLFSLQFQLAMSDLLRGGQLGSMDIAGFLISKTYIDLIDQIFGTYIGVNFNRHTNKLYPELTWSRVAVDDYLAIQCYRAIDPDVYTDAWKDRWLMRYATALVKRQWGQNIKKFGGIKLTGDVELNGQVMFDEAQKEIEHLEETLITDYSLPPTGFMA